MSVLVKVRVSLCYGGPEAVVVLACVDGELPVSGVYVADRPLKTAPADASTAVCEIDATGLLEGHIPAVLDRVDVERLLPLAAEVLRVATTGALVARGLHPVELTDWEQVASQLLRTAP